MRWLSPLYRSCCRRHRSGTPSALRVPSTLTGSTGIMSAARPPSGMLADERAGLQYGPSIGVPSQNDVRPLAPSQVSEMWMWLRWQTVSLPSLGVAKQPLSSVQPRLVS